MDSVTEDELEAKVKSLQSISNKPVHVISAVIGENVEPLLFALLKIVDDSKATEKAEQEAEEQSLAGEGPTTWQP